MFSELKQGAEKLVNPNKGIIKKKTHEPGRTGGRRGFKNPWQQTEPGIT